MIKLFYKEQMLDRQYRYFHYCLCFSVASSCLFFCFYVFLLHKTGLPFEFETVVLAIAAINIRLVNLQWCRLNSC